MSLTRGGVLGVAPTRLASAAALALGDGHSRLPSLPPSPSPPPPPASRVLSSRSGASTRPPRFFPPVGPFPPSFPRSPLFPPPPPLPFPPLPPPSPPPPFSPRFPFPPSPPPPSPFAWGGHPLSMPEIQALTTCSKPYEIRLCSMIEASFLPTQISEDPMLFACLPPRSTGYRAEACGNRPTPAGALGLLTLTLLGTSGLAVLHMVLLVPGSQLILSREHVAGMLALCGFAMLAAQLFHVYFPWLIASPRALAFLMLTLFSTSLLLFPMARSPVAIAVLVAMAGWAGASLRLLTSLWIGGEGTPSGARLGLQQSATSLGPALAPLAVAVISADRQFVIVWALALSSLMMTLGLSRLWPERGARFCSCPRH